MHPEFRARAKLGKCVTKSEGENRDLANELVLKLESLKGSIGNCWEVLAQALGPIMSTLENAYPDMRLGFKDLVQSGGQKYLNVGRVSSDEARKISESLVDLSESLRSSYQTAAPSERSALADVLSSMYVCILRPLWVSFPELKPPEMSHSRLANDASTS